MNYLEYVQGAGEAKVSDLNAIKALSGAVVFSLRDGTETVFYAGTFFYQSKTINPTH